MNVAQSRTLILNTLTHLSNCKLTSDIRLYNELKQYIEEVNDEAFQQDFQSINASCDLLKTITKISDDNNRMKSLTEDLNGESKILLRSLRIYTKMKQYPYTPLQILLKLELLFDPILDHSKICHNTNFKLSKNIIKGTNEQLVESTILENSQKRLMLFRELADAPLDDMIAFLATYNKTFYDLYNYDRITYVVFRLRNLSSRAQRSNNVYDKLCFFINSELKETYQLDIECLLQLLLDQFESINDGRYRKKLIDFVKNVYSEPYKTYEAENPKSTMIEFYNSFNEPAFTFVKFFEYIQEDSVLTEKDQSTFATLFEIYCKKLARILPCAPSQPLPQSMISCQSDDSESTKSSGNRRRDRRPRKNNRTIAAKEGKFSRYDATGNRMFQDTEDDYYANQDYPSAMIPDHSLGADDNWRYTPNNLRYHERLNYYGNSYVHQPRQRNNKQQKWIDENY